MRHRILAYLCIVFTILTAYAYAAPADCDTPAAMIDRAFRVDRMAFTAQGIVHGRVLQLYTRADGYFYVLLFDGDYEETCRALVGSEFMTHRVLAH